MVGLDVKRSLVASLTPVRMAARVPTTRFRVTCCAEMNWMLVMVTATVLGVVAAFWCLLRWDTQVMAVI